MEFRRVLFRSVMLSEWLARCPRWLCEAPANAWAQLWPEDRMLQLALYCAFGLGALTVLVLLQVLLLGEVSRRDRKSVVLGKRVSVRVDLGGRRKINKKKPTNRNCLLMIQ